MSKVFFHKADKSITVNFKPVVKQLIEDLFDKEKVILSKVDYIFCSDEYLLKINLNYLKHNYFTDIISFCFSKKNEPIVGEIYLSIDRIKENAKTYKVPYQTELLRVIIHGALHLCGYKDETEPLKKKMRFKEDFYLKMYDVSREANF